MEEKNLQKSSSRQGEPQPPLSDWLRLALDDLKMIAAAALVDERPSHTLQATALISEFWLRIADR